MINQKAGARLFNKHPKLLKISVSVVMTAVFVMGGVFYVRSAQAQTYPAVLSVTDITPIANSSGTVGYATIGGGFAGGWRWVFNVSVPHDQTLLKMKFDDWKNSSNGVIPAKDNIRFYSAQSTNASDENHAIGITGSNTYSDLMYLNPNIDSSQAERQIQIVVEAQIPAGSAGGSYSTSYGINATAPAIVTLGDLTQTYNSSPLPVTITTDPASLATNVTYTGIDVTYATSTTAPTNVGTYAVYAEVTDSGYTATSTAFLKIAPFKVWATVDLQTKTYGDPDPKFTFSTSSSLFDDDEFTGVLARDSGEDVGQYTIATGTLALGPNYLLTVVPNTLGITAKNLTVSVIKVNNKVYDGTTLATTTGNPTLIGKVGTDDVTLVGTPVGAFADKNVGTAKLVVISGLSLSGTTATNYNLIVPTDLTADITALPITVTAQPNTKVYDGNTSVSTTTPTTTPALAAGDSPNFTETYSSPDVGTSLTLTPSGDVDDNYGGKDYSVTFADDTTGVINPVSLTANITADSRVYDGNTDVTVHCSLVGIIGTTCNAANASFDTKDVGKNKTVTATGITLGGADAGNYTLSDTTAITTADITIAGPLTIIGLTANNKVYDRTTLATTTGTPELHGVIGKDNVTLEGTYTAAFDSQHVGTGKTVIVTGYTLGGNDAKDYTLTQPTGLTADITALALSGTITASDKTYDGSRSATAVCSNPLNGIIDGDSVICNATNATFDTKDVGIHKTVTADLSLTGDNASDYSVNSTATAFASITPASLTVSATGVNKTYDGTNSATVTLSDDRISGDTLTDSYTSANFLDPHVGDGKPVDVYGIAITGGVSGDYNLTNTQASTTANIIGKALEITANDATKIYGDTKNFDGTEFTADGLVTGDNVTCSLTSDGSPATAPVGTYKIVPVCNVTGPGSGNYTISYIDGNLTVAKKNLTANVTANDKTYDGTPVATFSGCTLNGVVNSDPVTCNAASGSFIDKNAGSNKTVTANVTLSNDGGNYTITSPVTTTSTINKLAITVTAQSNTKVYDGNTSAVAIPTITPGLAIGDAPIDTANFTESYASADVGPAITLTPSGNVNDNNGSLNYLVTLVPENTGVITIASQTITIDPTSIPSGSIPDNTFTLRASASSGLAVTFTGDTSDVCTVASTGVVTINKSGTCDVIAEQAGDTDYSPAPNVSRAFSVSYYIAPILLTSTSITSDGNLIGTLDGATLTTSGSGSCGDGNPSDCHTLNVQGVNITPSGANLPAQEYGFTLTSSSANLRAYFAGKKWADPTWLPQITSEIIGTAPFFYFASNGSGHYSLVDGFKKALFGADLSLVIDDDYPVGTYTFTGDVNGNTVTVNLTVQN